MKSISKVLSAALVCAVVSQGAFAYDLTSENSIYDKVSELNQDNYRTFSGYDFSKLDPKEHSIGLTEIVNSEIDYVIRDDIEKNHTGKYAIVGHSQGGLRVLAYATMLKRRINDPQLTEEERAAAKANYERLGAVITVSGIDKGLLALDTDYVYFKSRLTEDAGIILNGFRGATKALILPDFYPEFDIKTYGLTEIDGVISLVKKNAPDYWNNYVGRAWDGAPYSEIPELYDMVPNSIQSSFIRNNVAEVKPVTYRRQTGTKKEIRWAKKWGWLPYFYTEEVPTYTVYTQYKDVPLFDRNLNVGYIIGTESNTLSLISEGDREKESSIREGISTAAKVFNIAQKVNAIECISIIAIFTGHIDDAINCGKARDWFNNVDGEINELKGSNRNDGLVAFESQFYPRYFYNNLTDKTEEVHVKTLGKTDKGYVELPYNHAEIDPRSNDEVQREIKRMLVEVNF